MTSDYTAAQLVYKTVQNCCIWSFCWFQCMLLCWMISAVTWLKTIHVLQPWAPMFSVCSEELFIKTCFKSIGAAIFNTCELVCLLLYVYISPHVQKFLCTIQPANIQACRFNILYTSRSLHLRGILCVCVCVHFICCILHQNSNTGKHILDKYILLKKRAFFVRTIVFFVCFFCIVKNTLFSQRCFNENNSYWKLLFYYCIS